jgi:hypothetical protein
MHTLLLGKGIPMRTTRHFGVCIVLLAWTGMTMGAILQVPAGYPTIQGAIDAASDGSEIEVAPGMYTENINFNGKAVRLYSSSGDPTNTTIHGTGDGSVVTCASGEGSGTTIAGFTITGGHASFGSSGAGMYNCHSSPTVANCTFSGNSGTHGGGMYNDQGDPMVTNCTFSGNSGDQGGGMANENGSNPSVANCLFTGNGAGVRGGGMCNIGSSPTVTGCTFTANNSYRWGGGMGNLGSSPTLTNCTFVNNRATEEGGGMSNDYGGSPTLTNCVFRDNLGMNGLSIGGMRNFEGSNPTVINCIFSGNSGAVASDYASATLTNCVFSSNSGTGVFSHGGDLTMANCILWSNSGSEIYVWSGSATVAYCDVEGGWPGTGNIDADPLFVDAAGGDFHLSPNSPCLDAGDNGAVPSWLTTDLNGDPRIQGAAVDMGAYESLKQTPPPVIESISADPSVLWPPNHKMVPVTVTVVATDGPNPTPASKIVSVTCNEPVNGPGDGNTSPGWEIMGVLTLKLRAERDGGGAGRVYTIRVECTGAPGETATATVDVTVPHDQGKGKK